MLEFTVGMFVVWIIAVVFSRLYARMRHKQLMEETKGQKVCITCKHYARSSSSDSRSNFDKCSRPPIRVNLVTGEPSQTRFAEVERHAGACGREGKFWEEKK